MGRGRPAKSLIRDRMQAIVDTLGVSYGYEIFLLYKEAYEPIEIRSMYYHLSKGVKLGVFEEVGFREETGSFTWGKMSVRKYYVLGSEATKKTTPELQAAAENISLKHKEPKDYVERKVVVEGKLSYSR